MASDTPLIALPYRPPNPNEHWLDGAAAYRRGIARSDCALGYPGSRWEWQAGWEYEAAFYERQRVADGGLATTADLGIPSMNRVSSTPDSRGDR